MSNLIQGVRATVNTYGVYELECEIKHKTDRNGKSVTRDSEDRGQLKRGREVTFIHPTKSILKKLDSKASRTLGGYSSDGSNKNKKNSELKCYCCRNLGHI